MGMRHLVLTALEHQEGSTSVSKGPRQFHLYLKELSPHTFVLAFKIYIAYLLLIILIY